MESNEMPLQPETPASPAGPASPKRSRTKQWAAGAAIVGAMLGASGIAMAQTSSTTDPAAGTAAPDPSQATHPGETLLTGDVAASVSASAQKAVPDGTIQRVETDAEGSPYEAHMVKADGSQVTVKVDESFNVTAVETGPGPGGPGGGHAPAQAQSPTA